MQASGRLRRQAGLEKWSLVIEPKLEQQYG
jgi:hypothetical protein